ncbi:MULTISPECIES: hypothetical protein [Mycolicibacterium]|jgi:hypothetical protein|uniref:Lipoprotein n=2 Tax=Mycolicibacterium TaxID=1866885 RepID=A0A0U1DRU1_9MYCO|nr:MULTISPECIES: hypothetical protein [Mycolicibacterium]KLI08845.1 hypothetical protein AA982_07890 [Mycolicibacterium senegalense]KLO48536.1 hypothetical protein ABW05_28195 [Mycolicibacterium senegalense]OBJ93702.1 hypothetical protein A5639_05705 [Mycolicibacterium conceptionense]OMB78668.1 hypothetical protein A5741_28700 [Mycolicibacterium conceptionense]OMC01330.1 hypothetical protein A5746_11270 [Mycolicibacterium conceptionense]
MTKHTATCLIGALAVGLAATACSPVTEKAEATTTTAPAPTAAGDRAALASLLPTPTDVQQSTGPDDIADGGIHLHYQVNGSPNDVMTAYQNALQGKGWALTTIISSSGGGGGGATYTGTHGDAYGVFDGGGYANTTYIDVCTWAAKPANPNCSRGDR